MGSLAFITGLLAAVAVHLGDVAQGSAPDAQGHAQAQRALYVAAQGTATAQRACETNNAVLYYKGMQCGRGIQF